MPAVGALYPRYFAERGYWWWKAQEIAYALRPNYETSKTIKEMFENYKNIPHNFKSDLINILVLNVNSDEIKYKIVLNVICEYERVSSIEKLLAFVNNKYKIK